MGKVIENKVKGTVVLLGTTPEEERQFVQCLGEAIALDLTVAVAEGVFQVFALQPDVVLLSLSRGIPEGLNLLRQLKDRPQTQEIPVVLILHSSQSDLRHQGFSLGMIDYLLQPFHPQEVQRCLRPLLEQNGQQHRGQQVERSLQQVLYALAHDLRNPVIGMQMVLQNLLDGVGAAPEEDGVVVPRPVLERMLQGSHCHLKQIDALIDAHTCQAQRLVVHPEPLQLGVLIADLVQDLAPLLEKNRAGLVSDLPATLPPINADPKQIRRVFEHLITNALKHNPPAVQLRISADLVGESVSCCVQDNGVGIPVDQCGALFQLHQRGENARYTHGLGLGLFLCQQIVESHGGKIAVESEPGAGAKFWLTLPIASAISSPKVAAFGD